ncbi:hypothetical protein [Clostridium thermobutyricum]|uniref:Uncharacterized protein n=1 Tax=Clostridium thermobutyricum TaxID=29372 RepID=N9Y1I6_9CLOT|nr:hypothetical protein [Clostridium thermobutyricum]ENZ01677.1 hypothetical protein HMPREF1092_00911 [Clostridium thermobutyricum]
MINTKTWTEADTITLDRMIKEGCSNKMIAKYLARPESYISAKKKTLGYNIKSIKHWTKEEDKELRYLYYAGATDEELAIKFNRTPHQIYQHRYKKGYVELIRYDWDKKFLQEYFINQLKSSKNLTEAMTKTKLSYDTIKKYLRIFLKKKIISKKLYDDLSNKFSRKIVKVG